MKRKRRGGARPEQIVGESSTPVFLVLPDRRIGFFNRGCEELTGWASADVVGQLCEYVADPSVQSVESLAASLCPPAEAFEGRIVSAPVCVPSSHHDSTMRMVNFLPLQDEGGHVAAVLGVIAGVLTDILREPKPPHNLHGELASLRVVLARRFGTQSLVCRSDPMLRVAEQLSVARTTPAAVLIHGERGSGKEHIARSIHYESESRNRSFVPLDCRRLSSLELEQTLRRLFDPSRDDHHSTSAAVLRPGTVFLADVERLPRDVQKIIVEAFRPERGARSELRLIASTTLEPSALGGTDSLRPDFFHLLTPLCISVPPLRHRMEDLRYLAQHLLEELNRGEARQLNGFGDDVWGKFADYNWPGNVDELATVIREARAACDGPLVRAKDLPFRFRTGLDAQAVGPVLRPQVVPLEPLLAQTEKLQIERALEQCRHNKSKAAQLLGMTRPRLYRRMEILGIPHESSSDV